MRVTAAGADLAGTVIMRMFVRVPVMMVMSTCVFIRVVMVVIAGGMVVMIATMRMPVMMCVVMDMRCRKAVHGLRCGGAGADKARGFAPQEPGAESGDQANDAEYDGNKCDWGHCNSLKLKEIDSLKDGFCGRKRAILPRSKGNSSVCQVARTRS